MPEQFKDDGACLAGARPRLVSMSRHPPSTPIQQPVAGPEQGAGRPSAAPSAPSTPTWWWLPLSLALLLSLSVSVWLEWSDRRDREQARQTLISDALSLEQHLSERMAQEQQRLHQLASRIASKGLGPAELGADSALLDALRQPWVGVTWLDANHRWVGTWPPESPGQLPSIEGQSLHFQAPVPEDAKGSRGVLVARLLPSRFLREGVPWWLAHKYDVRILDSGTEQVLATTGDSHPGQQLPSYRLSMGSEFQSAYLELETIEPFRPWWKSPVGGFVGVFVLLLVAATVMLQRQVQRVMFTREDLAREVAWRKAMEDSLTVALRARDLQGRLIYVNRRFADLTGYTEEELVGRLPPMPYWPPEVMEETMARHQRNMQGGAPVEGYEARWMHKDGTRLDVMVFEAPLIDARGRHVGWMGSIVDISPRLASEARERHQAETLAHHSRLSMLGEIASMLAHELNQPLMAVVSYNSGMQHMLRQPHLDLRILQGALQRQAEQAQNASRVVQRIRDFLTRRHPQKEAVDVLALARDAVHLMQRELQRERVQVQWQWTEGAPAWQADPVLIEQVLINLLRNAVDALAEMPAHLHRRIDLSLEPDGAPGAWVLWVDDSGPGLGGRDVESLCAPFHSTKPDGMGMGLAICRSIVEVHQARLSAGVSPAGGARWGLHFQSASRTGQEPAVTPAAPSVSGGSGPGADQRKDPTDE